jgi:GLPGLI family protein
MKKLLMLILVHYATNSYCQSLKSEGFVDYQLIHHYDTIDYNKTRTEPFRLYYNSEMSFYRNLDRIKWDSSALSKMERAKAEGNTFKNDLGVFPVGSFEQYFTILKEQQTLLFRNFLNVNYLVKETEKINWSLKNEQQNILGYSCQKAVGQFKGREYIVWFTNELPYSFGPWKLNGLPGIVLLAEDSKGEVSFKANGINTYTSTIDIKLPQNPKYTTSKELTSAIKAYKDNPNAFQNQGLIKVEVKKSNIKKNETKVNNPIELVD